MADLREEFVQYVVKALVSNPDAVSLRRVSDDRGEYLELTVDPADMGKVIGKAGATAKSLRTLLRGVGAKDDFAPLPLKIVDPQEEHSPREAAEEPAAEQPAVAEAVAEEPVELAKDEHQELHDRTKREMEELADLEF
jgi:uncharacterized protein